MIIANNIGLCLHTYESCLRKHPESTVLLRYFGECMSIFIYHKWHCYSLHCSGGRGKRGTCFCWI